MLKLREGKNRKFLSKENDCISKVKSKYGFIEILSDYLCLAYRHQVLEKHMQIDTRGLLKPNIYVLHFQQTDWTHSNSFKKLL